MERRTSANTFPTTAFLTVVEDELKTIFGGLLVVNAFGRPLEFHCTAPVTPTRAQQILYGSTLKPFLYGEHVGGALLGKLQSRPAVVCVDQLPTLALQLATELPVVLVQSRDEQRPGDIGRSLELADEHFGTRGVSDPAAASGRSERRESLPAIAEDRPQCRLHQSGGVERPNKAIVHSEHGIPTTHFRVGPYRAAIHADYPALQARASETLGLLAERLDLLEPFERIREAIAEARRGV